MTTLQNEPVGEGEIYMAQLVSRQQVAVYPQITGIVVGVLVKPGDIVKAGAPLLQVDPRREAAQLANQVAVRAQLETRFELARRTEERTTRLFHEGLASQAELDRAKGACKVTERELAGQNASISAQSTKLDYFRIVAPRDGIVGDIPVKLGDLVSTRTKVTSVVDNSALEAYVNLPIEKSNRIGDASLLEILGPSGDVTSRGIITFVAKEADPELQSLLLKARIPNEAAGLRAAQIVRSRVVFDVRARLRVPASSLMRQVGQHFVFVVENEDRGETVARQRAVRVGDFDASRYTIIEGLTAGEKIVVTELSKLRDGVALQIREVPSTVSTKPRGQGG